MRLAHVNVHVDPEGYAHAACRKVLEDDAIARLYAFTDHVSPVCIEWEECVCPAWEDWPAYSYMLLTVTQRVEQ